MRIVSLIASATEIVHALELGRYQIGRSHECDFPPEMMGLPVCTSPTFAINGSSAEIDRLVKEKLSAALSIYNVFAEVLEGLQPTHIITQTQCKVCAVSLDDVERALAGSLASRPKVISLEPNSLADIWADIRRVARACGVQSRGEVLIQDLKAKMEQIQTVSASSPIRPRVACIEWHEPLMAAGNWVPELVEMANGQNLFGVAGLHSPWMSWEQLEASDPDVIISMPCGFDLQKMESEMYWLTRNPIWPKLKAVQNRQVYLADGNQYLNRPGPRIVESLRILAEILHPGGFEPSLQECGWKRFPRIW